MKLAETVQNTFLNILKAILVVSGIILSSKTPGSDIKDRMVPETTKIAFNIFKNVF